MHLAAWQAICKPVASRERSLGRHRTIGTTSTQTAMRLQKRGGGGGRTTKARQQDRRGAYGGSDILACSPGASTSPPINGLFLLLLAWRATHNLGILSNHVQQHFIHLVAVQTR